MNDPAPPLTVAQAEQAAALWRAVMAAPARQMILTRHREGRISLDVSGRHIDIDPYLPHNRATAISNA